MAAQPTPTVDTIPTPPDFVNRPATAHAEAVAMFNALKTVAPQIDAVGQITYANALSVELSAAVANAKQWESGTYSAGAAVWSPAATATGSPAVYIRKVPGGASPTDPYSDSANWAKYLPSNTTGGVIYTASATLSPATPFAIIMRCNYAAQIYLPNTSGIGYSVKNDGDFDVSVIDQNGDCIGFINPKEVSLLSCTAGEWSGTNLSKIGVDLYIDLNAQSVASSSDRNCAICDLDSERVFFVTHKANGTFAGVFNKKTGAKGAILSISVSVNQSVGAVYAIDQNRVLFVINHATTPSYGGIVARVANISANEITSVSSHATYELTLYNSYTLFGCRDIVFSNGYYIYSFFKTSSNASFLQGFSIPISIQSGSPSVQASSALLLTSVPVSTSFSIFNAIAFANYIAVINSTSQVTYSIVSMVSCSSSGVLSLYSSGGVKEVISNSIFVNASDSSVTVMSGASTFSANYTAPETVVLSELIRTSDSTALLVVTGATFAYCAKVTIGASSVSISSFATVFGLSSSYASIIKFGLISGNAVFGLYSTNSSTTSIISVDNSGTTPLVINSNQVISTVAYYGMGAFPFQNMLNNGKFALSALNGTEVYKNAEVKASHSIFQDFSFYGKIPIKKIDGAKSLYYSANNTMSVVRKRIADK